VTDIDAGTARRGDAVAAPPLPQSFYGYARTAPDRIAVRTPAGAMTFGQLGDRVNRISRGLQKIGITRGDRVGQIVGNDAAYWEVVLAAGQIGVSTVPINNTLAPPEIEYILRDSAAKAVLASDRIAAQLNDSGVHTPQHRFVVGSPTAGWRDWASFAEDESADPPDDRVCGMAMGYTSGTSGRPKGVLRNLGEITPEQGGIGLAIYTSFFGFTADPESVHLCCSPLYHAAPAGFALGSLHMGHTVVCLDKFDPTTVLAAIAEHHVTSTHMVPTHFHRLLQLSEQQRAAHDIGSLRSVVHAGAACPRSIKAAMLGWLGPIVWEYYGATEGALTLCTPDDALSHPGSVGRPFPGVSVLILDDAGEELPAGEDGTIYFRMGDLNFDYHNDPAKTAASRRKGHATVGDIGHLGAPGDEGYLYLSDRREDVIISGGVNIYPAEVEARIIGHRLVQDVAVVATPDPEWGATVTAVVELVDGVAGDDDLAEELRQWCRAAIARQKVPRTVLFASSLPRTAAGKLSRRKVRESLG
jgi:long-chain acyl-CoA synthetase